MALTLRPALNRLLSMAQHSTLSRPHLLQVCQKAPPITPPYMQQMLRGHRELFSAPITQRDPAWLCFPLSLPTMPGKPGTAKLQPVAVTAALTGLSNVFYAPQQARHHNFQRQDSLSSRNPLLDALDIGVMGSPRLTDSWVSLDGRWPPIYLSESCLQKRPLS